MTDTIAAISTAMGNSGINIIRISGEEAFDIAKKLLHWDDVKIKCVSSHTIHHGYVYDGEERIDEVLVSFFKSPKTYTREDIVEINCHGGSYVTKKILGLAIRTGARIAEPGEFTKRAFLNGRIDLSQAEAVMDVIKAQNDYALKSAEKQLSGGIREKINPVKNQILSDVALIEASLDDPENIPLDEERIKELSGHINDEIAKLEQIIKNFENGKLIKEGIKTVIVGKPNVGKSSFLNYISGSDIAIVTDIPGTTRDAIEENINIGDISLNIVDTAGIRDTDNEIERIGIERAKKHLSEADLVLFVMDSSRELTGEDIEIAELIKGHKCIIILNKTDLDSKINASKLGEKFKLPLIEMSAANRTGLDTLEDKIKEMFFNNEIDLNNEIYISNMRQEAEVRDALESLKLVKKSMDDGMSEDFYTIDLMNAYNSLGTITGDISSEDLVNKIFSDFCMGK